MPSKVYFPKSFFLESTVKQQDRQLFLAVSVVQLSPEAKLKSDKGLWGPERKETTHLLYSTQSLPHKFDFRNRTRKHVLEYVRVTPCSKCKKPHFHNCQRLLPFPLHARKLAIIGSATHVYGTGMGTKQTLNYWCWEKGNGINEWWTEIPFCYWVNHWFHENLFPA